MKIQDYYELTFSGEPIDSIPIPPEFFEPISKFKKFEDSKLSEYEIHTCTGISLFHIRVFRKQYRKTFKIMKGNHIPAHLAFRIREEHMVGSIC